MGSLEESSAKFAERASAQDIRGRYAEWKNKQRKQDSEQESAQEAPKRASIPAPCHLNFGSKSVAAQEARRAEQEQEPQPLIRKAPRECAPSVDIEAARALIEQDPAWVPYYKAARMFFVSTNTICRWVKEGKLVSRKIGRVRLVNADSLRECAEKSRSTLSSSRMSAALLAKTANMEKRRERHLRAQAFIRQLLDERLAACRTEQDRAQVLEVIEELERISVRATYYARGFGSGGGDNAG